MPISVLYQDSDLGELGLLSLGNLITLPGWVDPAGKRKQGVQRLPEYRLLSAS